MSLVKPTESGNSKSFLAQRGGCSLFQALRIVAFAGVIGSLAYPLTGHAGDECSGQWFWLHCEVEDTGTMPIDRDAFENLTRNLSSITSAPFDLVGLGFTTGLISDPRNGSWLAALMRECGQQDVECRKDRVGRLEPAILAFVHDNILPLSEQAVQGGGDYVTSLARLYGIQGQDTDAFAYLCKSQYEKIFNPAISTPEEFRNGLESAIRADKALGRYLS